MTSKEIFLKKAGLISFFLQFPPLMNGNTTQSKMRLKNTRLVGGRSGGMLLVIGGELLGCAAAILQPQEGAKTLLIEAMGQLWRYGNRDGSGMVSVF